MKTSDMIRRLCEQMNISVSELARRLGQSPQNFGKKLKRETITLEELKAIADVMDVKFERKRKIQHIYKKCPTYEKIKS